MAVYILSNRKIIHHKGERVDSFSNDEYSIPNFRIAKCDFENYKEPTAKARKKKGYINRTILNYKLFSEPEISFKLTGSKRHFSESEWNG